MVFGPDNRGNVYTLLEQIARGRAVVVGDGRNRKSMAYVENVAGVLVHALTFGPGVHVFNYADKPDLDMNELTALARAALGDRRARTFRIPYVLGLGAAIVCRSGCAADGAAFPGQRDPGSEIPGQHAVRQCARPREGVRAPPWSARRLDRHHPARVRIA